MHIVLRLLLFTAILSSVIYGQGGGGGSRGGSRSRIGRSKHLASMFQVSRVEQTTISDYENRRLP